MTQPEDPYGTPAEQPAPPSAPPPSPYGEPAPPVQPPAQQYGAPPAYGQPPPGYGQPPQGYGYAPPAASGQLASWIHRVGGRLIDGLIVVIPAVILEAITGSRAVYYLVVIILGLGIGYLNGAQGQSPGKRLVGLRLIRETDGQLIGGGMGIVREVAHVLDTFSCLIGWLWPLWDSKKQTFADKICGTVVLKV